MNSEIDTYLIEVTRHDVNDIIVGRQYIALFLEDASDGRYLCSNVTTDTR